MRLTRRIKARGITTAAAVLHPLLGGSCPFPVDPRRLLVIKPCCLGDVLLATPAIASLRAAFPAAQIDVAVGPHARVMLETSPHVNALVDMGPVGRGTPYPPSAWFRLARQLRDRRYDAAIVLDRSPLSALLAWEAGIPVRAGIDSGGRGVGLTHAASTEPVRHEAELYLDVLRAAGVDPAVRWMQYVPPASATTRAQVLLQPLAGHTGPLLAIHPAGGENPGMTFVAKRWTPEGFGTVAREWLASGGRVVLLGSPGETTVSQQVTAGLPDGAAWLDLTGQTTLPELAAVIAAADGFLGNDTGPMHLACAVGTPVVAVFGPSSDLMYGAWAPRARTLVNPVYCRPCLKDGLYVFAPDCVHQCMTGLPPQRVLAAVREVVGA